MVGENDDNTVTISKEQYEALLADSSELGALYAAGVDNWEGYCVAMESLDP